MEIKEFYTKNKYIIKETTAFIIFIIALIPMYVAYAYYANYDTTVDSQLIDAVKNVEKANDEIKAIQNNVEDKKKELEQIKNEKDKMVDITGKYPIEDRQTAIYNTKLYLMNITQDIETTKIEPSENGIIPGEIDQIPFILECKSTYTDMVNVISRINERKFLYVKDINIKLEGSMLNYSISMITLSKKTVATDTSTPQVTAPQITEIKTVLRANPFGASESSTGGEVTPPLNTDTNTNGTTNNNTSTGTNTNVNVERLERLYPLNVDAELVQDYKQQTNVINDNLTNFSHCISLSTNPGTKVMSVKAGKVIYVGKFGTNGNSVMIEHKEGNISYYGNLGSINVIKGQKVKTGQVIGYTGGTGDLAVPHLKFGYSIDSQFVDPKQFLDMTTEDETPPEAPTTPSGTLDDQTTNTPTNNVDNVPTAPEGRKSLDNTAG